jgi:hypothetical protein
MSPEQAIDAGLELVRVVREEGRDAITAWVRKRTRYDLEALTVTLAAMVPEDRSVADLLAWCSPDVQRAERERQLRILRLAQKQREVKPHGTHPAFNRHKSRGEEPCDLCIAGERLYQRERKRPARGQQKGMEATA